MTMKRTKAELAWELDEQRKITNMLADEMAEILEMLDQHGIWTEGAPSVAARVRYALDLLAKAQADAWIHYPQPITTGTPLPPPMNISTCSTDEAPTWEPTDELAKRDYTRVNDPRSLY